VIDADPLRQRRLTRLLAAQGIDVTATSHSVARVADLVELHRCAVAVISPEEGVSPAVVFSALRRAHRRRTELVSIALIAQEDPAMAEAALAAGAAFVVDPASSMEEVARLAVAGLASRRDDDPLGRRLTRRELEILRLVAAGRSNRQVARLLWVTDQTVKFHLANSYRKLGVTNRFDASRWAVARGLVRERDGMLVA
jgi:DNA-binding NarL/FixJ family response regulator